MAARGARERGEIVVNTVILWDVMDTLVRDPFFTHVASFLGVSFPELMARKHPTAWGDFEVGKLDEPGLYTRFYADGTLIDGPGLKQCMRDAYAFVDGIEALLGELKAAGIAMHALSNYSSWYRLIDERLGLSRYVELSFISCNTGVRKPAAGAFLGACTALGCAPHECLFVDDRMANCKAAEALGMPSIHFQGDVAALRSELVRHRLLERG